MPNSDSGENSTESSNSNESGHTSPPPQDSQPSSSPVSPKPAPRRRLVQATEVRFQCIEGRVHVARVAILLCNISDRPLYYKFKTDTLDLLSVSLLHFYVICVSALPSATGHIPARGSSKVVLTWTRPKNSNTWQGIQTPKLLLVTRFLDAGGQSHDQTSTRLIAFLDSSTSCPSDNPPLEQLMLDALSTKSNEYEMTVTKTDSATHQLRSPPNHGTNSNFTLALTLFAIFLGVCLYRALFPVAVVVR